jgi:UDP-N-acetylglucosamine acyltransferase
MGSKSIHSTAIVDAGAHIADGVTIGPYAIVGPGVTIGEGTTVASHAVLDGTTRIGKNNRIGRHACIGADPQDLRYKGEETFLEIGDGNMFGDFTQICRGTTKTPTRLTKIGNNNFLMAYVHVAHDCLLADDIIIANAVQIAGHVEIEDHAHIGGLTAIHQFCLIGRYAMLAGASGVNGHVAPYVRAAEWGGHVYGLNLIGLKRSGKFNDEQMRAVKDAYRIFFRQEASASAALARIRAAYPNDPNLAHFCEFIERCQKGSAAGRFISRARPARGSGSPGE